MSGNRAGARGCLEVALVAWGGLGWFEAARGGPGGLGWPGSGLEAARECLGVALAAWGGLGAKKGPALAGGSFFTFSLRNSD